MLGGYNMGGGFMENASQNSPIKASQRQNLVQQTLRPVTIKQLIDAEQVHPDSPFKIDNHELHNIIAIGCIRGVKQSSIGVTYSIEDGTASMDAVIWTRKESDGNMQLLNEGTWVQVSGSLKSFNNKKSINSSSVQPIVDFNQVTFHMLSAINCHLVLQRGLSNHFKPQVQYGLPPQEFQQQQPQQSYGMFTGFTPIQAQVWGVFKECNTTEGLNVHSVIRRLNGSFPESQLRYQAYLFRDTIRFLIEEGHLYSTVDDDHARCTS